MNAHSAHSAEPFFSPGRQSTFGNSVVNPGRQSTFGNPVTNRQSDSSIDNHQSVNLQSPIANLMNVDSPTRPSHSSIPVVNPHSAIQSSIDNPIHQSTIINP